MTYKELVSKFLEQVAKIKALNPAYKQPGDGSSGVCDCIGLIIGALKRMGISWKGIHGSNYAARYQTVGLSYIASESELELGDAVYKGVGRDGKGRRPCNAGTFTHKWDLPDRYLNGHQYANGDTIDYYHVGVVTQVNPLRITHMTSPSMKVDTSVGTNGKSPWNYHGKIKPLVNAASGGVTPTPAPTPEPVPTTGSKAIVIANSGKTVKMRQYPSKSCATYDDVKIGETVTIVDPGETWAKINYGRRTGWYMMAEFLDIIGDGQGKY